MWQRLQKVAFFLHRSPQWISGPLLRHIFWPIVRIFRVAMKGFNLHDGLVHRQRFASVTAHDVGCLGKLGTESARERALGSKQRLPLGHALAHGGCDVHAPIGHVVRTVGGIGLVGQIIVFGVQVDA